MKKVLLLLGISLFVSGISYSQTTRKYVIDAGDTTNGYYLVVEPAGFDAAKPPKGVLVLFSGFTQQAESILPESKLPNVAAANGMLTICYGAGYKLYADSLVRHNLSTMFTDVLKRYRLDKNAFVIGGFSAGGTIALRYAELCAQYPRQYPINPKGVFMVDSPIDIFTTWNMLEQTANDNFSAMAVEEANTALDIMRNQFGIPTANIAAYAAINPFSMNKAYGENEKYLRSMAVRAYHDVDISWRLVNRRQTVHNSNYEMTSELINRLLIMGNTRAEFIQSKKPGYRANGMRHPHSWSIVDEVECVEWVKSLLF